MRYTPLHPRPSGAPPAGAPRLTPCRSGRPLTGLALLALCAGLGGALHGAAQAAPDPVTAVGTLAVLLPDTKPGQGIEMPDAKVWLLDKTNQTVGTALTQLDGQFRVSAPVPGVYQLCWDIQGRSACQAEVVLRTPTTQLRRIERRLHALVLHGRVLTGDGRPCWVNDPFFKLDVSTQVNLQGANGQGVARPVRANTLGDYLFALDQAGAYQVHAQCEKAEAKAAVNLQGSVARADLAFKSHAPRIDRYGALDGGQPALRVAPGAALKLQAQAHDRDGLPVEYLWRDHDAQPITAGNSGSITRTAAALPGRHTSYVVARNGHGGYAWQRIDVDIGPPAVRFAGRVIDELTRQPVADASVQLGSAGSSTTTNAQGWFSLSGAERPDARYVLNIRHRNYALMSQVFDRSSSGHTYELIKAHVRTVPPNLPINVVDTDSSGPCGPKGDGQTGAAPSRRARLVEYFDPEQREARPLPPELLRKLAAPRDCRHVGAQIIVPAGAMVDAKTRRRPVGAIRVAAATLDPTRRPLAGDYQATDRNGQRTELLSYGAVYAEFRDATGRLLNLRPGSTAEVRVPVPPSQRATAQPQIDFWSYDEASGRWVAEGKAQLTQTAQGPMYVGRTRHFSELNMDVAGNDPAKATCVRVELDPALLSFGALKLRSTVSYNGNQVQTKETLLNGNQYHAIWRIPYGTAFPPNTLRLELFGNLNPGTPSERAVVLVDNVINTDAQPKMTGTNLWPPYPYDDCPAHVLLKPDSGVVPEYASDATNRPYFLTGPYGGFLPPDAEQVATDYYAAIGATANKPTLGQWWSANGFVANATGTSTTGAGEVRSSYLNFNDLGFGRDMHCRRNGSNVACYVTNYGGADQNLANADLAAAADPADPKRGATVAMEYDAANPVVADRVQFYVYGNSGASAGLLKFADLDGFGPKPVPHLCIVCHGGGTTLGGNKVQHARFREFDLPSFKYPGGVSWDYGAATLSATALQNLGSLNQMARDAVPAGSPIQDLISRWYPGNNFAIAPVKPTPPPGWNGSVADRNGYHDVYGQSCRTCHVARDEGAGLAASITFSSKAEFTGTDYIVCGKGNRKMPNAIVTYKNFWLDFARADLFGALMNPLITGDACRAN